jgi:hypothetical protein
MGKMKKKENEYKDRIILYIKDNKYVKNLV